MAELLTINDLIDKSTSSFADHTAFQMKRDGEYKKWSYREAGRMIKNLRGHLSKLGISKGDRVAILSENRPEWCISYLAVSSMGAVTVPLDSLISYSDHIYLINDSGAKGLIVSERFIKELKYRRVSMPALEFIVCMDLACEKEGVIEFSDIVNKDPGHDPEVNVLQDDLLSILYTSGTTGVSKGVMLTHKNIMTNLCAVAKIFTIIGPGDNFLSVLPIHHTFETTCGQLAPYYMGSSITYTESLKSYVIIENMQKTKVSVMCGVPLLYKIFFEGIIREAEAKGIVVKLLFKLLFFVSRVVRALTGKNIGRKLFGMVHKKLGGRIKFWVSGGAAIDPGIIDGYDLMGLTILQGYGLTETSPILTCCSLDDNKIGSVGRAIEGVTLKIEDPDEKGVGEIIAHGPNIMKGYFKKPDVTAEVIRDGWFHTGDLGFIDKAGHVYITGRIKDVIISGAGLNVYPEEIERELDKLPMVSESCALGRKVREDVRKGMEEIIVLVIPDREYFKKYSVAKGLAVDEAFINKVLKAEIAKVNERMPEHRRIASYIVREAEFPKTSTKKIKRFMLRKEMGLV